MNNKDVIWKLNHLAERIKEGESTNALIIDADYATACELDANVIQILENDYIQAYINKHI